MSKLFVEINKSLETKGVFKKSVSLMSNNHLVKPIREIFSDNYIKITSDTQKLHIYIEKKKKCDSCSVNYRPTRLNQHINTIKHNQ